MSLDETLHIVKEKSQSSDLRLEAILSIVEQFLPEHFLVFEDILQDDADDAEVRSAVALALGKLGGARALEILRKSLTLPDETVRNYVVQALGMLGTVEAAPVLIQALKDSSSVVFGSAAEALGRLGKPVVPYLIALLAEGADDARCIAAWQLGEIKALDALPALVRCVREERNTEVLALAIWALGEIGAGPQEVLEILQWAKAQENPEIHFRAHRAIKKIARHSN